jgi:hypothetical protein
VIPPPDETWPLIACASAPYAGDELIPAPTLEHPARAALVTAHRQVLLGERSPLDPALRTLAAEAGVLEPEPPTERLLIQPLPRAPILPADSWLSDLAENVVPDLSMSSAERVLGPMADEGSSRRARRVAAGVMAFSPYAPPRIRPFDRWAKDKRGGTDQERAALRAIDRAPAMCWVVDAPGHPTPLLPMSPRMLPQGPVHLLPDRGGPSPGPLPIGTWLARMMIGPEGWYASLALPLEARPDPTWLLARLSLELWQLRCFVPEADWILLLRERAEVLYRCCHEWAWTAREATP